MDELAGGCRAQFRLNSLSSAFVIGTRLGFVEAGIEDDLTPPQGAVVVRLHRVQPAPGVAAGGRPAEWLLAL
jgi:hypothetical protein